MIEPSRLRKRIVAMHASLVVVIVVCAASALVALRTTLRHSEDRRVIDERLSRVERIRGDTREIAVSARRYVLAGDLKEQQRVLAIAASMGSERERLRAASLRPEGVALDTGIDAYVQAVLSAMTAKEGDAIARLGHFEDELMRARKQLAQQFDLFVSAARAVHAGARARVLAAAGSFRRCRRGARGRDPRARSRHTRAARAADRYARDRSRARDELGVAITGRDAKARARARPRTRATPDRPRRADEPPRPGASIERLEGALADYPGALIVVSHDARFAERLYATSWTIERGRVVASRR